MLAPFAGNTIPLPYEIVLIALAVFAFGEGFLMWRGKAPRWAFPIPAMVVAAAIFGLTQGPTPPPAPPQPPQLPDMGDANFATRYQKAPEIYGQPIGCATSNGFTKCWTTNAVMGYHPEVQNPQFKVEGDLLGTHFAEERKIPTVANPILPAHVLAYVNAMARHNQDPTYFLGNPISNPVERNGRMEVYFQRAVLFYPKGSVDVASVQMEPVGAENWGEMHGSDDPGNPDPWTTNRRMAVAVAAVLLLLGTIPVLLRDRLRRRGGYAAAY